jgi:ribosome-binding protein aMBF1 (putative translation factor)
MAVVQCCDFCGRKITEADEQHRLVVDDQAPLDVCLACFHGSVCLSERRRIKSKVAKVVAVTRKRSRRVKVVEAQDVEAKP